jgi:uncharacterized membrane protein YeaQ/YmgE (transglycosylase-associated protein family)
MDSPKTGSGALHLIIMGATGAVVALLIAQFFPSIIPARAAAIRL